MRCETMYTNPFSPKHQLPKVQRTPLPGQQCDKLNHHFNHHSDNQKNWMIASKEVVNNGM